MMSNYGYKKKSVPVIFEPPCMLHNIYFMHFADNLRRELWRKLINLDLGFMGTYGLLDSHKSLLDPTSVFMFRLRISNLILKGYLRNRNIRTHWTRLKKYSLNSQISFKNTIYTGHIFLTSKQLITCRATELDSDEDLQNM